MGKIVKVRKQYRLSEDLSKELDLLVRCANSELKAGDREFTETSMVELGLRFYINEFKVRLAARASVTAKCKSMGGDVGKCLV